MSGRVSISREPIRNNETCIQSEWDDNSKDMKREHTPEAIPPKETVITEDSRVGAGVSSVDVIITTHHRGHICLSW